MKPTYFLSASLFFFSASAAAQQVGDAGMRDRDLRPGAGAEFSYSSDGDGTEVIKADLRGLIDYRGPDDYKGLVYERAWFRPFGGDQRTSDRFYVDLADTFGGDDGWVWHARVGTDGHTVLGSAEIRTADWRQSYSLEREIVETPMGLDRRIYYTFAGANFDVPVSDAGTISLFGGFQEFTGSNERLHARIAYSHVIDEDAGLSARVRALYYHSTRPFEFDYYSPKNYLELLPTLRLRRFTNDGWQFRATGGIGAQTATGTGWHSAIYANLRIESPRNQYGWDAFGEITYSNISQSSGIGYDYVLGRAGVTAGF